MFKWYIYALCDPDTYEPRYYGYSKNPQRRLRDHCYEALTKKNINLPRYNWIRKLYAENKKPEMVVLESFGTKEEACDREKEILAIEVNSKGNLNVSLGGEGGAQSPEVHKLIGKIIAQKFEDPAYRLRHREVRNTPEYKAKMSARHLDGNWEKARSDKIRTSLSENRHVFAEKQRQKMSIPENRAKHCKRVLSSAGEIFSSYVEAGKHYGVTAQYIYKCVKKGCKIGEVFFLQEETGKKSSYNHKTKRVRVTGEGKDEVFDSVKELALEYGVHYNTASRALAQNRLFLRKYILSYVD